MNIQKYEAFLKTVELGSVTSAARVLGYTQSGITHMLNAMEREMGLELLIRDRAGARLTADGERLYPLIREVVNTNRVLDDAAGELRDLYTGLVRIGTFTSISVHILPKLLRDFKTAHPGVDFELHHGEFTQITSWLLDGRCDIGCLRYPLNPRLQDVELGKDRLLVILPEGHPLAEAEWFPIEQLGREPFILLEEGDVNAVDEIFARYGIAPDIRYRVWNDYAVIAMVESGLGISIVPELLLRRSPHRIVAKELEIPEHRRLNLAVRAGVKLSPAVSRFLEFAQAQEMDFGKGDG